LGGKKEYGIWLWFGTKIIQPIEYSNWGSGEPNGPHQSRQCLEMTHWQNLWWNDQDCKVKIAYACQAPATQS